MKIDLLKATASYTGHTQYLIKMLYRRGMAIGSAGGGTVDGYNGKKTVKHMLTWKY